MMESWLIQANIVRLQIVLQEELNEPQRRAIERLIAEQRAKLEALSPTQREKERDPA
jgi:hypothetical protein